MQNISFYEVENKSSAYDYLELIAPSFSAIKADIKAATDLISTTINELKAVLMLDDAEFTQRASEVLERSLNVSNFVSSVAARAEQINKAEHAIANALGANISSDATSAQIEQEFIKAINQAGNLDELAQNNSALKEAIKSANLVGLEDIKAASDAINLKANAQAASQISKANISQLKAIAELNEAIASNDKELVASVQTKLDASIKATNSAKENIAKLIDEAKTSAASAISKISSTLTAISLEAKNVLHTLLPDTKALDELNNNIKEAIKVANNETSTNKSELVKATSNITSAISHIKESTNKEAYIKAGFELSDAISSSFIKLLEASKLDANVLTHISKINSNLSAFAKNIASLATAKETNNISDAAFDLSTSASDLLKAILDAAKVDDKNMLDILNTSLASIKKQANALTSEQNKAQIASHSIEIIKSCNELIAKSFAAFNKDASLITNALGGYLNLAQNAALIASSDDKAKIASSSIDMIASVNEAIKLSLAAAKIDSSKISDLISTNILSMKDIATNLATTTNKVEIAKNSLDLIAKSANMIKDAINEAGKGSANLDKANDAFALILDMAKSSAEIVSNKDNASTLANHATELSSKAIKLVGLLSNESNLTSAAASTLNKLKDDIANLASAKLETSEEKAKLASAVFNMLAKSEDLLSASLKQAGLSDEACKQAINISKSSLNMADTLTSLVAANAATKEGSITIAANASKLASDASNLLGDILEAANIDAKGILSALSKGALSMQDDAKALASTDDIKAISEHSINLFIKSSKMIDEAISASKLSALSKQQASLISKATNNALEAGKLIAKLASSNSLDKAQISEDALELSKQSVEVINSLLAIKGANNDEIATALKNALEASKSSATNLAKGNLSDKEIALNSLELIQIANKLVKSTLDTSSLSNKASNIATTLIDNALNMSKSLAASVEINPASKEGKAAIAATTMAMLSGINTLAKDISAITQPNNQTAAKISEAVANALLNIKDSAINLAQTSADGNKSDIAIASFKLLSGANVMLQDSLKAAGLNNTISDSIAIAANGLMKASILITNVINANASSTNGKQAISKTAFELASTASEVISSIAKLKDANVLSKVAGSITNSLTNLQTSADEIIKAAASSNKEQIATSSLELIKQTNNLINSALDAAGASTETSTNIQSITNDVLDASKMIASLSVLNSSSKDGKAAIAAGTLALIAKANSIIDSSLHAAGIKNEIISKLAGSGSQLAEIGKELSSIISTADTSTKEGNAAIAAGSLGVIAHVNDLVANLSTPGTLNSALNLSSSVINIGKDIATLVGVDANSQKGKMQIASGSLKIIGNANALAQNILELTKTSSATSKAISGVISGSLSSVGELVNSSLKFSEWDKLSNQDQIALGFDVGLKAVSTLASSIGAASSAINTIKGTTNSIPLVSQIVSASALAISPLSIAGLAAEHNQAKEVAKLGEQSQKLGYAGDSMLASLLHDQFALDTSYFAINTAMNIASIAISAAATASVIGAPIAAVTGIVQGIASGILQGAKQPILEKIASSYKDKILANTSAQEFFEKDLQAQINALNTNVANLKNVGELQEYFNADNVLNLDGVQLKDSAKKLSAITKLNEQIKQASNYASLFKDGKLATEATNTKVALNNDTGVLEISGHDRTVINFNTPLFAPGVEEKRKDKVGKNEYYTSLALNGPSEYTINDSDGSNVFISKDNYSSVLMDLDGKIIKHLSLNINGKGGDDTYIADAGFVKFDGGEGFNSVIYNDSHIHGIKVKPGAKAGEFEVSKNIQDAQVVQEQIKLGTEQYGKRTDKIEYRDHEIVTKSYEAIDKLLNTSQIVGSEYADELIGGDGNDVLIGGGGDDVIKGGGGNDKLYGGEGNDKLYAQSGDNVLDGGAGDDELYGGSGNDYFIQSDAFGHDVIDGAEGVNTLDLSNLAAFAKLDLKACTLDKGTSKLDEIKNISNVISSKLGSEIIGTDGDNLLVTTGGKNIIKAGAGNDVIIAKTGDNELYGEAGDDTYIISPEANNKISDNEGNNFIKIENPKDKLLIKLASSSSGALDVGFYKDELKVGALELNDFKGVINLGDAYYLDVQNAAIISAINEPKYDFSAHKLNYKLDSEQLNIYTSAQTKEIGLDKEQINVIYLEKGSDLIVKNFISGKDQLVYLSDVKDYTNEIKAHTGGDFDLAINDQIHVHLVGISDVSDYAIGQ